MRRRAALRTRLEAEEMGLSSHGRTRWRIQVKVWNVLEVCIKRIHLAPMFYGKGADDKV